MQKLIKFKVIFDLFTVCVYFTQQQNCKLYYIYLMIISEIQSEIGHCSNSGAKFKAPADFSHHAILLYDIVLKCLWDQQSPETHWLLLFRSCSYHTYKVQVKEIKGLRAGGDNMQFWTESFTYLLNNTSGVSDKNLVLFCFISLI